jgi:polyphosphate glucokinase
VLVGVTQPLEIAHLPYRDGWTYEELLGKEALDEVGKKRWRRFVFEIVPRLQAAFQVDEVVLGGGNSKLLATLPSGCRRGDNKNAFAGGFRLWNDAKPARRKRRQ